MRASSAGSRLQKEDICTGVKELVVERNRNHLMTVGRTKRNKRIADFEMAFRAPFGCHNFLRIFNKFILSYLKMDLKS